MCKTYVQGINRFQIKYGENYGYCAGQNTEGFFCWGVFRVFGRASNNCNFDSSIKNTNVPQFFLGCRTVKYDRHTQGGLFIFIRIDRTIY